MELAGIPTVTIGLLKGALLRVKCPRALITPFSRGETMGPPGDHATQRRVLQAALNLLVTSGPGAAVSFE